jgi:hypothetical protein
MNGRACTAQALHRLLIFLCIISQIPRQARSLNLWQGAFPYDRALSKCPSGGRSNHGFVRKS